MGLLTRRRRCADCRTELRPGSSADRCAACQQVFEDEQAELEHDRLPESPEAPPAYVDYSSGGSPAPRLRPSKRGQRENPRHDNNTRMKLQAAPTQAAWGEDGRRGDRWVQFRPAAEPERFTDALGRPSARWRPNSAGAPVDNPAALGMVYQPSSVVGRQLVEARKQASRFGENVAEPAQVHGGHFESGNVLQQQEQIAGRAEVQQRQAMSELYRHLTSGIQHQPADWEVMVPSRL